MEVDMSPLQEPPVISFQNLSSRKTRLLKEVIGLTEELETINKDVEHHKFWLDSCITKQKDLVYFMFKTKKELQELQSEINVLAEKTKKDSES